MPKRKASVPAYTLHKPTGQGRVRHRGRDYYLGPYNSPESLLRYEKLIAEIKSLGSVPPKQIEKKSISIAEVVERYQLYLNEKLKRKNPNVVKAKRSRVKSAFSIVVNLFGLMPVSDFGPSKLVTVQGVMIERKWTRKYINKCMGEIKALFAWAGGLAELVPGDIAQRVALFPTLEKNESDAIESDRVRPAPESAIEAVKKLVNPVVRGMIDLQLWTGMRSGELTILRPRDVDRSGTITLPDGSVISIPGLWVYRPTKHKTEHLGEDRVVLIGPRGQEILKPFLNRDPNAFCFAPVDALQWWIDQRRKDRKTPLRPSQSKRYDEQRIGEKHRLKPWGARYTPDSYAKAILYALIKADREARLKKNPEDKRYKVPACDRLIQFWHPHQLRHNAATRIKAEFGADIARIVLGHRTIETTMIYVAEDLRKAGEAMRQAG